MGKMKIMISGRNLNTLRRSGKYPCGVCFSSVGRNSILCSKCSCWIHKKCSNIHGPLKEMPNFVCARCSGSAHQVDVRSLSKASIDGEELEVVDCFCYLGDMVSAGGGCRDARTTGFRCVWEKFRELLPLLTSRSISIRSRGYLYETCVRSSMLHGCACKVMTT